MSGNGGYGNGNGYSDGDGCGYALGDDRPFGWEDR